MSKCKSAPIICPRDMELIACLTECTFNGMAEATGQEVLLYKFNPDMSVKDECDEVYSGGGRRGFEPPRKLFANIETHVDEEEFTPFGNRSTGREDDNFELPDVKLIIPVSQLDEQGIVLDTENRDEYRLTVNRKDSRFSVIATHYPKGFGGMELFVEIYLIEKG